MTDDLIVVSAALAVTGIVVATVATRAADGRLRSNWWAGLRTKTTRSSEEAWLAAHQAALPWSRIASALLVLSGATSFVIAVLGNDSDQGFTAWVVSTVVLVAPAIALMIYGSIQGQRAAKEIVRLNPNTRQ